MFKVAVVEDDERDRQSIARYLEKVFSETPEAMVLRTFEDGESFLRQRPHDLDLVLLDIDMPGVSGIDVARRLRAEGAGVQIVFVTNMYQFALEGYSVQALDFVVKPVRYAGFRDTILRAINATLREKPRYVEFAFNRETRIVDANTITYVETSRKKLVVHTRTETFYCDGPLREVAARLEPLGFCGIHQSYLVNMRYVEHVGTTEACVNGEQLPLSRHRRKAFVAALTDYVGREL